VVKCAGNNFIVMFLIYTDKGEGEGYTWALLMKHHTMEMYGVVEV
jgi:hypothetical protein